MSFPVELLRPEDSAICFFVAAFGGRQDLHYLRLAGLKDVIAIDNDSEKLHALIPQYPKDWTFSDDDGFAAIRDIAAKIASPAVAADVITLDPWTGDMTQRVIDHLPVLSRLAKRVLVVGVGVEQEKAARAALAGRDWPIIETRPRSALASWVVARRA